MKKTTLILASIYLIILLFSRFYNLEYTARFTEDESGFLVRVHQIFVERKITLVGQVNEGGTKVFGSLSVYLLLPFAVLGKFTPVSVFYGAAFWGVLTSLVLLYLIKLANSKLIFLAALFTIVWFPLVQQGRWAWNPNFIPLWTSLGIICYFQKRSIFWFLGGLFLGLSVHHHYWTIFAVGAFTGIVALESVIRKNLSKGILFILGIFLALIPFVIFDLRHPPGLFVLGAGQQAEGLQISLAPANFVNFTFLVFDYYAQSRILAVALIGISILIAIKDFTTRCKAVIFLVPVIFQIFAIALIGTYFPHYFFAAIPFFLVWVFYPRRGLGKSLQLITIVILIIGSAFTFIPQLTTAPVEPDLGTVTKISNILRNEIQLKRLKNVNISVLASPDHNTFGRKYRDILLVPGNIQIMSTGEYGITDNLFVVSTSGESVIRADPAYEISNFKNGELKDSWRIDNSGWVVYHLIRNPS
jgi:hypothetical protein